MPTNEKLEVNVAVRMDEELHTRIAKYQEQEQRRAIGEMVRILLIEALDRRDANGRRKRA